MQASLIPDIIPEIKKPLEQPDGVPYEDDGEDFDDYDEEE